jgi:hypothetical protein
MTETTIRPNRFRTNKPQQEEVITEVEVVEEEMTQEDEDEIINAVSTTDNTTKRTRTIKKEEVVEVEENEPEVKSVVKPASSVPRKLGYFVKPKVERVVEPVVEVNEITGKDYLDKLSELFVQYAEENDIVIESQTEDGEVIATGINKDLSELLLSSFEDFFANNILPKYDKVDFFNSRFEKHIAVPNFRKSAPSKTKNDGQDSYIYSEGDTKTVFQLKLESSPNRAYLYVNEDSEVERIERVNDKKETTEVTDGSLDYLIPELEKYIKSKSQ